MKTAAPFTSEQKRMLMLSSLGGVLEFYDFIIYIFLAPFIEKVFFSGNTAYIASLKTFAIFAVGYLVRPIGGIVFSHFGDRYGRKVIFLLTVLFMALPSFAISLLPTPAQIGFYAPVLLLVFRIMQGFALGGEIPAAITFVAEHVSPERRSFALSTLFFGINIGLLLGSLVTTIMTSNLSPQALLAYGWRIPFFIGGVFGITSIFLRRYLRETSAFQSLSKSEVQRLPLLTLMKHAYKKVILGVGLVAIGSVSVFLYLYWPQYLHQNMHYNFDTLMRVNTASTLELNIVILIGGLIADKIGPRRLFLICTGLLVLFTYPLFTLFNLQNMAWVIFTYLIFSLIFGCIPGTYTAMLIDLFPTSIRYTGIAMSYNLAYAIFGGLSPILCTLFIQLTGSILAPAFYLMLIATLSGLACYGYQRKSKKVERVLALST